ncbi:MAG: XrtA-associated tyrosine autokinase [Burkholderiales bacterium]
MSIVEKAVEKRAHRAPSAEQGTHGMAVVSTVADSIIEKAVRRVDAIVEPAAETSPTSKQSRCEAINLENLKQVGMITPETEKSPLAEEFRIVKRPLLRNAFSGETDQKNGNLVMITSALPGEGKTFCAVNLAISVALEQDRTVLLVDADIPKPSIPKLLGLQARKGLMDLLLEDGLTPADVLVRTNIDKLTVLPAGRSHRHATEILASESMQRLIDDLANRYPDRFIIFDSPPLITSEAGVIAHYMGQIVMVVEAERTPQEALKEALGKVAQYEVSLLINKRVHAESNYGYGYGYGSYVSYPASP